MRLDKYLKVSRLIKRRTVANEACDAERVTVNGRVQRASYDVKAGDVISIRFGASTAAEDERDLDRVWMRLDLFRTYAEGFLSACGARLCPAEIETLPLAAKLMTLECGIRFLADHIQGDTYFRIHREKHNLDRTRTQLKLVADMENKMDEMARIVSGVAGCAH